MSDKRLKHYACRPNQHHVFDVLHFVKAAFKRDVLDKIEEADCLNKEAYKWVFPSQHTWSNLLLRLSVFHLYSDTNSFRFTLFDRYHESTTSFAALATQTASLSHSPTALYDKDQPSITARPSHGMHFSKLKSKTLKEERARLGLKEWALDWDYIYMSHQVLHRIYAANFSCLTF